MSDTLQATDKNHERKTSEPIGRITGSDYQEQSAPQRNRLLEYADDYTSEIRRDNHPG